MSYDRHQSRDFFIMSHENLISNSPNDESKISEIEDSSQTKTQQIGYFWKHYSRNVTYKERCALRVAEALECFEHKGEAICDDHPRLFLDEIDATIDCINELVNQGLPRSVIRNNVWILYFTKCKLIFLVENITITSYHN